MQNLDAFDQSHHCPSPACPARPAAVDEACEGREAGGLAGNAPSHTRKIDLTPSTHQHELLADGNSCVSSTVKCQGGHRNWWKRGWVTLTS